MSSNAMLVEMNECDDRRRFIAILPVETRTLVLALATVSLSPKRLEV
jgi:hypothetical protein